MIFFRNKYFGSNLRTHFFRICLVSNSRRTLFDYMICMKLFGSKLNAHVFPIILSFKPQVHPLKLDLHRWVSSFASLSFELQVTQIFDLNNIVEVRTPLSLFWRYSPRYLPILKGFDFVSQMGTHPSVRIFWYHGLRGGFFKIHSEMNSILSIYSPLLIFHICYHYLLSSHPSDCNIVTQYSHQKKFLLNIKLVTW